VSVVHFLLTLYYVLCCETVSVGCIRLSIRSHIFDGSMAAVVFLSRCWHIREHVITTFRDKAFEITAAVCRATFASNILKRAVKRGVSENAS